MHELIINAIERGGYFGFFLLMALENIFPPIPSEVIMGIGGLLVERGTMSFTPLLIIGTLGTVAGNYVWYWVGDKLGYQRLEPFIARWGRWLTLDWEDVEHATRTFLKHGPAIVFFLRFSPVLRTIISLPAGLTHMHKGKFLIYTFAGSIIWNALLILGGKYLGRWLEESQTILGWVILGLIGLGVIWYVWRVITWVPRAQRQPKSEG